MILLLGASGYLGQAFASELRRRGLGVTPFSRREVEYARFEILFNFVREAKPEFVINAAGYPGNEGLEDCEAHRAEAVRANTLLPLTVARVCYLTNTPWGHVSSGSIYSGAKVAHQGGLDVERNLDQPAVRQRLETQPQDFRGFSELDEPNFGFRSPSCSFYSGTKALAEEALHCFGQHYLWRPGLVFDECNHPRNYLSRILRHTKIPDRVNSYSHRFDFVRACLDLWQNRAPFGIYHVVNPGPLTGSQILKAIQRKFNSRQFWFSKGEEQLGGPEERAPRSSFILDSSKLLSAGVKLRPVQNALEDAVQRWTLSEASASCFDPLPKLPNCP